MNQGGLLTMGVTVAANEYGKRTPTTPLEFSYREKVIGGHLRLGVNFPRQGGILWGTRHGLTNWCDSGAIGGGQTQPKCSALSLPFFVVCGRGPPPHGSLAGLPSPPHRLGSAEGVPPPHMPWPGCPSRYRHSIDPLPGCPPPPIVWAVRKGSHHPGRGALALSTSRRGSRHPICPGWGAPARCACTAAAG